MLCLMRACVPRWWQWDYYRIMHVLHSRQVLVNARCDDQCGLRRLRGWNILDNSRRYGLHGLRGGKVLGNRRCDRYGHVQVLRNRQVLDNSGRNDFRDLHRVSSCIRLDMSFMRCCD